MIIRKGLQTPSKSVSSMEHLVGHCGSADLAQPRRGFWPSMARTLGMALIVLVLSAGAVSAAPEAVDPHAPANLLKTVRTLVPYNDLGKVIGENLHKFVIIPLSEFEKLKAAKESFLASLTMALPSVPPVTRTLVSATLEGRIEGDFIRFNVDFVVESLVPDWQELEILRGPVAVASVSMDDRETVLTPKWLEAGELVDNPAPLAKGPKDLSFRDLGPEGKKPQNWREVAYFLHLNQTGTHRIRVSFLTPLMTSSQRNSFQFKLLPVPLTFVKVEIPDRQIAIIETSLPDYRLETTLAENPEGCALIGWLGALGNVRLSWLDRVKPQFVPPSVVVASSPETAPKASDTAIAPVKPQIVKAPIKPLVYARTETLITLGEGAMQGRTDFEFAITKAPISRLEIFCPKSVEILSVSADGPENHFFQKEELGKRLVIDFPTAREDKTALTLTFDAKMPENQNILTIPEVYPYGVVRELGVIAIQALTSIEVQPSEKASAGAGNQAFRIDPTDIPETLKSKAARPILIAYRHANRPAGLELELKKYLDFPQQTVVADSMDAKTSFTTTGNSQTQVTLKIRNNNQQFISFQLATNTKVLNAYLNDTPIIPMEDKIEGKILVPLVLNKTQAPPREMELRLNIKQPIATMSSSGNLGFAFPTVDVPVSRFGWTLFAPMQFSLYNFKGTVLTNIPPREPFIFRGFLKIFDFCWDLVLAPEALIFVLCIAGFFMAFLARNLFLSLVRGVWAIITGTFRFIFFNSFRLGELLVVLAIIGILSAIAVPNFKKAREQARDKSCYANMRVILGGVEMFNMDNSEQMTSLSLPKLVPGYLKVLPKCPSTSGEYRSAGNLAVDGVLYCSVHGAVDVPKERVEQLLKGVPTTQPTTPIAGSKEQEAQKTATTRQQGRAKGVHSVDTKLTLTENFFQLSRDLVIPDTTATGAILANRTSPEIHFSYLRWEFITSLKILALVLGLMLGGYFILGAFHQDFFRLGFALLLLLGLSCADAQMQLLGDWVNTGLWLSLLIGIVWKIGWFISLQGNPFDDSGPDAGSGGPKGRPANKNPEDKEPVTVEKILARESSHAAKTLLVLFFVFSTSWAFATPPDKEIRLMIPFQDLNKVLETQDKTIILSEEDYRYMSESAPVASKPIVRAPSDFQIRQVSYAGKIESRGIRFKASFLIDLINDGWKNIPLLAHETIPSKVIVDGKATALEVLTNDPETPYGFSTNATGTKKVEAEFFVSFRGNEQNTRRFDLPLIPNGMANLEITAPDSDCEGTFDPGVVSKRSSRADGTSFTAILPPTNRVTFRWFRKVDPQQTEIKIKDEPKPASATPQAAAVSEPVVREDTRISLREVDNLAFEEGFVHGRNIYTLDVTGTDGIATFAVTVPGELTVLRVEGKSIDDWKLDDINATNTQGEGKTIPGKILRIALSACLKGKIQFSVDFEEDIQNLKDGKYSIKELVPQGTDRLVGILGISALPVFRLSTAGVGDGYAPLDVSEFFRELGNQSVSNVIMAVKFLKHGNQLALNVVRNVEKEQQTAIIDKAEAMTLLNEDGYFITRVAYQVQNTSEQFLKLRLPMLGSISAELWSSEVAFQPVKAGFDPKENLYNIPIIRSPIVDNQSKPFPVEIVFAMRLPEPLGPFMPARLELPKALLDITELSWILYFPEGYELMKGNANVDLAMKAPEQPLLNGVQTFPYVSVDQFQGAKTQVSALSAGDAGNDRSFGLMGLLPVKFTIPTTSYSTSYTQQQIDPTKDSPFIEGTLVTPRKGSGKIFSNGMILIGGLTGLAVLFLFIGRRPFLWFLVIAIFSTLLGFAVVLKLYQADHSFKMGFMFTTVTAILYALFRWNPESKPKNNS